MNINTTENLWLALRLFSVAENNFLECQCQLRYLHTWTNKQNWVLTEISGKTAIDRYTSNHNKRKSFFVARGVISRQTLATPYMLHSIIWSMCRLKNRAVCWIMICCTREYTRSKTCWESCSLSQRPLILIAASFAICAGQKHCSAISKNFSAY